MSALPGDDDNEPALNGWKDTEGRRGKDGDIVSDLSEDLEPTAGGMTGDGPRMSSSPVLGIRAHGLYLESCESSPEVLSDVRVEETAVLGANFSDSNRSAVSSSKLQLVRYLTETLSNPNTQGRAAK